MYFCCICRSAACRPDAILTFNINSVIFLVTKTSRPFNEEDKSTYTSTSTPKIGIPINRTANRKRFFPYPVLLIRCDSYYWKKVWSVSATANLFDTMNYYFWRLGEEEPNLNFAKRRMDFVQDFYAVCIRHWAMKEHLTARPTLIKVQSKTGDIQDFDGLYNVLTVDTIIPLSLKRTTDASGKNTVKFSVGSYPDISQPVLLSITTNFFKLLTA